MGGAAAAAAAAATAGAISVVMNARALGASRSSEAYLQKLMTWVYSGTLSQCNLAIGAASIAAAAAAAAVGRRERAALAEDGRGVGKGLAAAEAWAEGGLAVVKLFLVLFCFTIWLGVVCFDIFVGVLGFNLSCLAGEMGGRVASSVFSKIIAEDHCASSSNCG